MVEEKIEVKLRFKFGLLSLSVKIHLTDNVRKCCSTSQYPVLNLRKATLTRKASLHGQFWP
jgi:hypothetical protein